MPERISREYVRLVLALGRHDPDYVDAYYGPTAVKAEVERQEDREDRAHRRREHQQDRQRHPDVQFVVVAGERAAFWRNDRRRPLPHVPVNARLHLVAALVLQHNHLSGDKIERPLEPGNRETARVP